MAEQTTGRKPMTRGGSGIYVGAVLMIGSILMTACSVGRSSPSVATEQVPTSIAVGQLPWEASCATPAAAAKAVATSNPTTTTLVPPEGTSSPATFDDPTAGWPPGKLQWTTAAEAATQLSFPPVTGKYIDFGESPVFFTSSDQVLTQYPRARVYLTQYPGVPAVGWSKARVDQQVADWRQQGVRSETVALGNGFYGMLSLSAGISSGLAGPRADVVFGPDGLVLWATAPLDSTGQGRCQVLRMAAGAAKELAETTKPSQSPADPDPTAAVPKETGGPTTAFTATTAESSPPQT
jgi:hypothetical protein